MNVGFFLLSQTQKNSFIGSILVTTEEGLPLEYKFTSNIEPSTVQKALYGEVLEKYIAVELCGKPLFKSLENEPDILFIKQEHCLSLSSAIGIIVVCIKRSYKNSDDDTNSKVDFIHVQKGNLGVGFDGDTPQEEAEEWLLTIKDLNDSFDLVETFSRIEKANEIVRLK